ncbi:NAD(P)H-dependent glycerol-3-phosphate dehydrogenase [Raineyella sp. LH-20]|uniref:NAD(P)H-dependent glycerol-3-phosphate dehydrogenase n=1 Tax=Raineyella sp. LH-20 TaxID=3081204 RepID=UPI002954AC7F|nr:NAD(P)H-dependent glycerol-3-phosphate dehydrogenase [Raineyella sp. LH-20]WOP18311.1 NAD(P)H-dependent glycerol-3-phosphate dehydrogenase [Raineyella sp. LH-20]
MAQCCILGAGNWATAFARVLADAGHHVTMVARRPAVADAINQHRRNPDYLSDIDLGDRVDASTDPVRGLAGADLIVLALPAQQLRGYLRHLATLPVWRDATAPVLSLVKGIETGTDMRMSEVIAQAGGVAPERIAVLSGPNLAREIAERQPSLSVVAAHDPSVAVRIQQLCLTPSFRTYTVDDVVGVEFAGAAKNVIALAVGMGEGLGYGHNALASLITRGLHQVAALGEALGGRQTTFAGLAGLGDLIATCMSPLSRNRTFGERLGRGLDVAEASRESAGVAEGVATSQAVRDLARAYGVDMPIVEGVVAVLEGRTTPAAMVPILMEREPKPEL